MYSAQIRQDQQPVGMLHPFGPRKYQLRQLPLLLPRFETCFSSSATSNVQLYKQPSNHFTQKRNETCSSSASQTWVIFICSWINHVKSCYRNPQKGRTIIYHQFQFGCYFSIPSIFTTINIVVGFFTILTECIIISNLYLSQIMLVGICCYIYHQEIVLDLL